MKINLKNGFSLVEVLVGMGLFTLLLLAFFGAFQLSMQTARYSRAQVTALALANQIVEQIRNLPYDQAAVLGGIPAGLLPQNQTIIQNGIEFEVKTIIVYVDDPFDNLAPIDTVPIDYKKVIVEVSWLGWFSNQVTASTLVSPKGVETTLGGGTIKITVFDAQGNGVSQAEVRIVNDDVVPNIDVLYQTNVSGNLVIAGAPVSNEGYQITVSKVGWSTEKTYGPAQVANPAKPHLSVFEGQVTETSFSIDKLSQFNVSTRARKSFDDDFGNWNKIDGNLQVALNSGQVELADSGSGYFASGYLESIDISPGLLLNWDHLAWQDQESANTDIKYQVFYDEGVVFSLVPEVDLPGNLAGFDTSPVDLSGLDITTYYALKIKGNLSTASFLETPILFDWRLVYNTPLIGSIDFGLKGAKIIGTDSGGSDVLKFENSFTSDGAGFRAIPGLEWDAYTFSTTNPILLDLAETFPSPQPISLLPDSAADITLYFEAQNALLVEALDADTSQPIFGALVNLSDLGLGYNQTKPSALDGRAFFIPLETALYDLEIQMDGYQTFNSNINVAGDVFEQVNLTPLPEP